MPILLGLDVGTTGTKGVAVRSDTGAVLASSVREYPLYTPVPQWAEQDGEDFEKASLAVLADLAAKLGPERADVAAIGLTGQMHSAILLDARGQLLRRAILWCDTRTSAECRERTERVGLDGLRATVRNLALEGFTLPKLLWVRRHEPEVFTRIATVLMPKDWVGLVLTGVRGTEVSDASGTLAFDPARRAWSRELLAKVDINPDIFPEAGESPSVLGTLKSAVARATGLREGMTVVRGAADNAAGAVGLGVVRSGRAMVSLGTSGVVLAHTDSLQVDPAMRLHSFCAAVPGRSYLMGVMLSAGGALRWFRDVLVPRPYDELTSLAARAPAGAGGVVFLPYLMGERTPHNDGSARGAFVGLSAATGVEALCRAVLEGITYGLADSLDLVRALLGEGAVRELRATGGGARSAFWRQLMADVFATEVVTTTSTEGPAYGAAILAGVGTGLFASVEEGADALVKVVERSAPSPESTEYSAPRAVFRALYPALRAARGAAEG